MRLAVFTGSSPGHDPLFAEAAGRFAAGLASHSVGIVYGGGRVGLMGTVADSALAAGGEVIGVIPDALQSAEVGHTGLSRLHVVGSMHERKQLMADLADGFVALPGGIGTLEEIFEAWTWLQLGIHAKPIAFINVNGFWNPLLAGLDGMVGAGFVTDEFRNALIVEETAEGLLEAIVRWRAPQRKWRRPAEIPGS
ncbi:LOG family protein [Arthrobacter mobilis]|uniref:Cytokinin riboside 5'-monophosphate phosphoribohydrolase n=1 Tax=Arthrobacter mobilis TaxID=2724944 RepID=A0A7X6HGK4_9MICC|nr:TIGR00730 family Rossman fold protein [Arthrobacter mobilis]NKX55641.1 TIGR00730 family Rossman fold protein [Arthrobacter mobilis]